jgi:hypothetical protein
MEESYFISGVWFDASGKISHVFLHENSGGYLSGIKTSEADAIKKIKGKKTLTMEWNYSSVQWERGAEVHIVGNYLTTHKDDTTKNNLRHLINMSFTGL